MKRLLLAIFVILSTSIAGAFYYAYYIYIPEKIENRIINSFGDLGFNDVKIGNITRKNGNIVFSDIAIDKQKFSSMDNLSVYFSLAKFLLSPNNAQKIIINGLNLNAELSKDLKLTILGWDRNNNLSGDFNYLPATTIIIKNSNIELITENIGGIKINYNGQVKLLNSNKIEIKGSATSKQKRLSFNSKINATLLSDGSITIITENDQISLSQKDLSIRRGAAEIKFIKTAKNTTPTLSLEGDFSSINWENLPLRDVYTTLEKNGNNYTIIAEGKTFGNENIEWKAQLDKANDIKKYSLIITPAKFSEALSFLQKNKILDNDINIPGFILNFEAPQLSVNATIDKENITNGYFKLINSAPEFRLDGYFSSNKDNPNIKGTFLSDKIQIMDPNKDDDLNFKLTSTGEFMIRNTSKMPKLDWFMNTEVISGNIRYGLLNIANITGKFLYNSDNPQKVRNYLNFNLPLKSHISQYGKIWLNIEDKSRPLFNATLFNIYDGHIKMQQPILKNGSITKKNKLIISDINMTQLFHDAGFKDVIIFGQLGGVMPLNIKDNKINVNGAILQSQGGGIIRLPQNLIMGLFPGKTKKMRMIREALENYHYEFFEIRLDGNLAGRIMMTLNANGYNPDIDSKQLVPLNLQIETKISLLFKDLLK